jgi:branched-chain amino acid transport system substrate-binding protein
MVKHWTTSLAFVGALAVAQAAAAADKQYGPGVTDTEIRIGQTSPYSGPAWVYSTFSKTEVAYLRMINERGGVNGRKINLISLDDGYSAPKTVEQTRRLVEQDNVLGIFHSLGTAPNAAIQEYLNEKHVPHFAVSGASRFNDPAHFPWTMGVIASYETEGRMYAKYILQNIKDPKIAVLYQNDDLGKDYLKGLRDGLGAQASRIIAKALSYELANPTVAALAAMGIASVDPQVLELQASGANVFLNASSPKFSAQAIRKAFDSGWRPAHFLASTGQSIPAALVPAGVDKAIGIISASPSKDPSDAKWANDKDVQDYLAFMKSYFPEGDVNDSLAQSGYRLAQAMLYILERCGDKLTRENLMDVATHMRDVEFPLLLPGVKVNTSPTNYRGYNQMQLVKFDGTRWVPFSDIIGE